jgi:2-amino-4-hydroxy-6-hydroxymethyldihydropteridine diphosphokinase
MAIIHLAFGSNVGHRRQYITQAIEELRHAKIIIQRVSSIIETEPQGCPSGQNSYLNCVVRALTDLSPHHLLAVTRRVELDLGRTRPAPNSPRTIDIDILLYDELRIVTDDLEIPHPRMRARDFVMNPLREISPDWSERLSHADF